MSKYILIAPSILAADFGRLSEEVKAKVKKMREAYDDDKPTAVMPGTDRTITGTAINAWLDDEGNRVAAEALRLSALRRAMNAAQKPSEPRAESNQKDVGIRHHIQPVERTTKSVKGSMNSTSHGRGGAPDSTSQVFEITKNARAERHERAIAVRRIPFMKKF